MRNFLEYLVAHYKLDDNADSAIVIDSTGFSNGTFKKLISGVYGTENTSDNSVQGKIIRAFNFDGRTQFVDTNSLFLGVLQNTFTLNFWMKPDEGHPSINPTGQQIPVGAFWDDDNFLVIHRPSGTILVVYQLGGESAATIESPEVFAAGGNQPWVMVTAIVTQLTPTTVQASLYVNGTFIGAGGIKSDYAMTTYDSPRNIWIGAASSDVLEIEDLWEDTSYPFAGDVDNVMFFNTALTAEEIAALMNGYYRVYRGRDGVIDYNTVQALMTLDATSVSMTNQNLPANSIWHYARKRVSDCGLESPPSPMHKIVINSEGSMILSTPNVVQGLVINQLTGGILELRWRYLSTGQEIIPTGFKIYMDSGSGFDFDDPVATVTYRRSVEHKWKSPLLVHGQTYKFCIRSYAANAGETINTDFVAAKADAQGPAAAEGLSVSWEEV